MVRAVREDKEAGEVVAMEEADPGLQGLVAGSRKKTKTATARIKPEKSLSSPRSWSRVSREEPHGAALLAGGGGGGKRGFATRLYRRGDAVPWPRWPCAPLSQSYREIDM